MPKPLITAMASMEAEQSEQILIERAKLALSHCNWTIGECASQWTQRYAKGRTDDDFAAMVGLTRDQVCQRRTVWDTFSDTYHTYPNLSWSHFYTALNWDDSSECLQWANEIDATVAEMRAWRRCQHGEDLSQPAEDDQSDLPEIPAPAAAADPVAATDDQGKADEPADRIEREPRCLSDDNAPRVVDLDKILATLESLTASAIERNTADDRRRLAQHYRDQADRLEQGI